MLFGWLRRARRATQPFSLTSTRERFGRVRYSVSVDRFYLVVRFPRTFSENTLGNRVAQRGRASSACSYA